MYTCVCVCVCFCMLWTYYHLFVTDNFDTKCYIFRRFINAAGIWCSLDRVHLAANLNGTVNSCGIG